MVAFACGSLSAAVTRGALFVGLSTASSVVLMPRNASAAASRVMAFLMSVSPAAPYLRLSAATLVTMSFWIMWPPCDSNKCSDESDVAHVETDQAARAEGLGREELRLLFH